MRKVELLAPAGDIRSFYAAISAGANAVYLAYKKFGARAYSNNFEIDEIKEMVKYAHLRDVKVFVVINTLIEDDLINELLLTCDELYLAGVDSFIVQDLGIIDIFLKRYRDMEIHASTQVNTLSLNQVKFLKDLGVKRVILGREASIDLVKEIKANIDIEVEVFVHGALCMSYSGECLYSSMIFSRSGNKGECAQPCRLKYSLDGKDGYLLSTKDLLTLDKVNELIEAGVDSFKIEGRMKRPEYVYLVTNTYRKVIDNNNLNIDEMVQELKKIYNRDFTSGYLFNNLPSSISSLESSNHKGIEIGEVIESNKFSTKVLLYEDLSRLDGIRFVSDNDYGYSIDIMEYKGNKVDFVSKGNVVTLFPKKVFKKGDKVLLTSSVKQINSISEAIDNERKIEVSAYAEIVHGKEILMSLNGIEYVYEFVPEVSKSEGMSSEMVIAQLSKLGNTPYKIGDFKLKLDKRLFVPNGILNKLKRGAVEALNEVKLNVSRKIYEVDFDKVNLEVSNVRLSCHVETLEQLEMAENSGIKEIHVTEKLITHIKKDNDIKYLVYSSRIPNSKDLSSYDLVVSDIGNLDKSVYNTSPYLNVSNTYTANLLFNKGVKNVQLSLELNKNRISNFYKLVDFCKH